MEIASNLKELYCKTHNAYFSADQLPAHLITSGDHKITKTGNPSLPNEKLEKTILSKIEAINKITFEILQSSVRLNQTISLNTEVAIKRLEVITRFYKFFLDNSHENKDINKTEIVSTFTYNESLNEAIVKYFNQNFAAKVFNKDEIKNRVKTQVKKLLENHSCAINTMTVFSNCNFIVTGGKDGAIRVWDTKNGLQAYVFQKHKCLVYCLALGSDNQTLLSGSGDFSVRLWNLESKKCIKKFLGHKNAVDSVQIDYNNTRGFSGSSDRSIKIWNLVSLNLETTITLNSKISCLRLIDCDKALLAGDYDGNLTFLTLVNKYTTQVLTNNPQKLTCMYLTEDGARVIIGFINGLIQCWMIRTRKKIHEGKIHSKNVTQINASQNLDIFVSCSEDKSILIWELRNFNILNKILCKNFAIGASYVLNSNLLAFCTCDAKIYHFDIKSDKSYKILDFNYFRTHTVKISSNFKYMAYGKIVVYLIDLKTQKVISKSFSLISSILCLKFSSDSTKLACGLDQGKLYILDVPKLSQLHFFEINISCISRMTISATKKLFGFSNLSTEFMIWNGDTNQVVNSQQKIKVIDLSFCLNDKRFVYSTDIRIVVLNNKFNKVGIFEFKNYILTVSADEKFVLGSLDKQLWCCINLKTSENLFDSKNRNDIKKWSVEQNDLKCLVNASLPGVNL